MGTKYTTETISGYNNSPPIDDGTQSDANKVKWATIKDKITDPVKDQVANIDTKLVAMADVGPDAKTTAYTTVAGDHQKTIEVTTASLTMTLLAIASAPTGYTVTVKNSSGGTIDVDATGSETIDGSATAITLADNETLIVQLNQAETGYISLQQVTLTGGAGLTSENTFTKTQTWAKGADIASATALALGTDGNSFDVTGTTTITSIGTVGIGTHVTLQFDGALTLTHHATDLILPGAANITTAAGDIGVFYEYATGDWRCVSYTRADGTPLAEATPTAAQGASRVLLNTQTASASANIEFDSTYITSAYDHYEIELINVKTASNTNLHMGFLKSGTLDTTAVHFWSRKELLDNATEVINGGSTDTKFVLVGNTNTADAAATINGMVSVYTPDDTTYYKQFNGKLRHVNAANRSVNCVIDGDHRAATAIDGVHFVCASGNISVGAFRLFGIKDA